jgi:hypothetical protein
VSLYAAKHCPFLVGAQYIAPDILPRFGTSRSRNLNAIGGKPCNQKTFRKLFGATFFAKKVAKPSITKVHS